MTNPRNMARARFERELVELLLRHGATAGAPLTERVQLAVDNMLEALSATSTDGASLSALEVVRIRANKLAAVSLPAALFRDPTELAALRAALHVLSRAFLAQR